MIFPFQGCILRFHVNLLGCKSPWKKPADRSSKGGTSALSWCQVAEAVEDVRNFVRKQCRHAQIEKTCHQPLAFVFVSALAPEPGIQGSQWYFLWYWPYSIHTLRASTFPRDSDTVSLRLQWIFMWQYLPVKLYTVNIPLPEKKQLAPENGWLGGRSFPFGVNDLFLGATVSYSKLTLPRCPKGLNILITLPVQITRSVFCESMREKKQLEARCLRPLEVFHGFAMVMYRKDRSCGGFSWFIQRLYIYIISSQSLAHGSLGQSCQSFKETKQLTADSLWKGEKSHLQLHISEGTKYFYLKMYAVLDLEVVRNNMES